MEWLKASQRDAFGGECQPTFTACCAWRAHLQEAKSCPERVHLTDWEKYIAPEASEKLPISNKNLSRLVPEIDLNHGDSSLRVPLCSERIIGRNASALAEQ
jgi:hypothetical protein